MKGRGDITKNASLRRIWEHKSNLFRQRNSLSLARMESVGLLRSMSNKGCPPDNAACEGVFGRIKNVMFYTRDWT